MRILYHFTSDRHIDGCREHGLVLGQIPVRMQPPQLLPGYQWLTQCPDWLQSWTDGSTLPYDRTANRIEIKIPGKQRKNVFRWIEHGLRLTSPEMFEILNAYGDPANWYVFKGIVQPSWFRAIEVKEQNEPNK